MFKRRGGGVKGEERWENKGVKENEEKVEEEEEKEKKKVWKMGVWSFLSIIL